VPPAARMPSRDGQIYAMFDFDPEALSDDPIE
jgi:hypothetical protein